MYFVVSHNNLLLKIESERQMENGGASPSWRFKGNEELTRASAITIRGVLNMLMENLDPNETRPVIPLAHGDPSAFPSFRTTPFAEDAVCAAVRSVAFNGYSSAVGIPPARRAVAEYLSKDLPYELSPDDVFLTVGCTQSVEVIVTVLARPGANILLPRPGFPLYEARAGFSHLEARHFDLLPEKDWEVDLDAVEALSDENTVAETARKLGILVIADEVYDHLTFGSNPFVPMGVFGSIVPVVTVGSISKRWIVPGWRLGWLVMNDPHGVLMKLGIVDSITGYLNITPDPATLMQGAIPQILKNTPADFYLKIVNLLRESADICYNRTKEIPCITCPSKPEGSMFVMVKLNLPLLEGIKDDVDFCCKLAKEESVIVLPGVAVGLKNWLRVTFAIEPTSLDDGLGRIKAFYQRHAKKQ
ncbi:tyrosine aminotransferase [Phtheirospermum japonicum]|uniref:Tyrosine aminotransferase n=1 Tax=Phtheirospermum japonicum TaxID=374723 RepID=A0A830BRQ7_9LAMI|nr:tyrosine aminotransferase [Phtheirospermum japonicum]